MHSFTEIRLQHHEYRCFRIISNIMNGRPGIYLSTISRHVCSGCFMLFSTVVNTSCMQRKLKDSSTIVIAMIVGIFLFFSAFNISIYESLITQKVRIASSCWKLRLKAEANSRLTHSKANSNWPLRVKLGWILYTFDNIQFLKLLQFLLDKVILFTLMICRE